MGSQDAPRKRRLDNGPWVGTMFDTENNTISKTVTQAKWNKGKALVQGLVEELNENPNTQFEYKRLEKIRGFLCHLAMTFDIFFAYLKGFHLTLSKHLPKRTDDGWKLTDLEWIAYVEERAESHKLSDAEKERLLAELPGSSIPPPQFVSPVPRFLLCLQALHTFF